VEVLVRQQLSRGSGPGGEGALFAKAFLAICSPGLYFGCVYHFTFFFWFWSLIL
jgi:hypothetical protein